MVGGSTAHVMTQNILKKAIRNSVVLHFSWAGKRDKKSFKDLHLAKVIARKFIVKYNFKLIKIKHSCIKHTQVEQNIFPDSTVQNTS